MTLPKDAVMLLSYINTQLRDNYSSLEDLCQDKDLDPQEITDKLAGINYAYDPQKKQFV